ncbi:MAG: sulfatase-like hydrolase/transferase [Actinomycetota bacterium]|nr:sulfatase-like hydrolase/transferase [Actinomycetota bacterium]
MAFVFSTHAPAAAAAAPRPNIVLVFTDDQRWDTLWAMPNVQRTLVAPGISFSNAFVVNPVCCPSRASTLTGRYSHATGIYRNQAPYGGFASFDDSSTIATWLHGAGYRTAAIGKYLIGYTGVPYVPPGWDHWVGYKGGYFNYTLNVDGRARSFGSAPEDYSTDVLAAKAVSFVEETPGPFFLMFSPFAPHSNATPAARHANTFSDLEPWRPPSFDEYDVSDKPDWIDAFPRLSEVRQERVDALRKNQFRSLLAVDEAVGAIVAALERTGRLENTLIVFTSDNGLLWGEHRLVNWKIVPWEESIRVPFVVRYDALIAQPRRERRIALNIDLAPTFAALAGAQAPGTQGRSLVPVLESSPTTWRRDFLIESVRHRALWPTPTYCAVRDTRFLYASYESGDEELYDLRTDPYQMKNAVGRPEYATILAARRDRLKQVCSPPPPILCTAEGGVGNDSIVGREAYDVVCAFDGHDTVRARGGNDRVRAAAGNDAVHGALGRDRIAGGPGADVLWGGLDADVVWGGEGADVLYGDAASDRLIGGPGRDRIAAGLGADRLFVRDLDVDAVACGAGSDIVRADSRDRVSRDCESTRRG